MKQKEKTNLTIYDELHPARHPYRIPEEKRKRVRMHPFLRFWLTFIPAAVISAAVAYGVHELRGERIYNFVNEVYADIQTNAEAEIIQELEAHIIPAAMVIAWVVITIITYKIITAATNKLRVAIWKRWGN